MDLELNDRAYLITGGTDGLGLALAKKLVSEGAHVAVCGRDRQRLDEAQETLGGEALCFEADVTRESELDESEGDESFRSPTTGEPPDMKSSTRWRI